MYCGEKECQRARKNGWRREKYAEDLDYRLNQRESTKAWLESVGGGAKYYREYRRKRKRGRLKTGAPSLVRRAGFDGEGSLFARRGIRIRPSANRDAIREDSILKTGRYVIFPVCGRVGANRDAIEVKIEVILDG